MLVENACFKLKKKKRWIPEYLEELSVLSASLMSRVAKEECLFQPSEECLASDINVV